jgi:hypothetical protein
MVLDIFSSPCFIGEGELSNSLQKHYYEKGSSSFNALLLYVFTAFACSVKRNVYSNF